MSERIACEACWNEAYRQSHMRGGGQVDHYQRLMQGRFATHPHPIPPATDRTADGPDGADR